MRFVVDLNRCEGYAQCVFLAPDVFELRGNEALHYDGNAEQGGRPTSSSQVVGRLMRRG